MNVQNFLGGHVEINIVSDGRRDISQLTYQNLDELLAQGGPGVVNTSTKW